MVGAKEFAMNRKVIQVQKKNPLIESITLPQSMRLHEAGMHKMTGSFLDKMTDQDKDKGKEEMHYAPRMAKAFDSRTINPILEDARRANNQISFAKTSFSTHIKKNPKYEEHKDDREEDISDELANRITYKVFQNIQSYLKGDMEKTSGGKHIKLEISL